MNKYALLSCSLIVANITWAGGQNAPAYSHPQPKPHHHPSAAFTGFTVMGAVGGVGLSMESNQQYIANVGNEEQDNLSTNSDIFARNVAGLLGFGYGFQNRHGVFVGLYGTAGANYAEFEHTSSVAFVDGVTSLPLEVALRLKLENDFGLLFKAGYVLNNRTLFYGLVGPRWGNFNTTTTATVSELDGTHVDFSASARDHEKQYVLGLSVGVGITQMLSHHFEAGIEYAFTSYGDLETLNVSGSFEDDEFIVTGQTTLEASTNTLMATLAYKF